MELDSLALTKNPSIRADIEARIEEISAKLTKAQQQRNKLEVNEADIDGFIKQARHLMEHLNCLGFSGLLLQIKPKNPL